MSRTIPSNVGNSVTEPIFHEKITISIPAKKKYAALLRLAVSSIGIRLDCTFDQIDDLKLAINEAFLLMLSGLKKENKNIEFNFVVDNDKVTIIIPLKNIQVERNSMSSFIINGVTDRFDYQDEADDKKIVMAKFINRKGG